MKADRRKSDPSQFLSGWKEIANYLGRGVRTVQRYEWQMGLPVRRPAGKPRGSVVATRPEIDAWVSASPIRGAFRLRSAAAIKPATAEFRNRLAEMAKLRDQMAALKNEVQVSVEALRNSLATLQDELARRRWQGALAPTTVLGGEVPSRPIFSLLELDTRPQKVS
ncbi:MAG: hypothetical protein WB817_14300 [Terriglobales bacterium]